jgi:sugar lactone lactonase YvrE
LETDRLVSHVDLGSITAGELSNMIVDHQGRAYVASFSFETGQSFTTARVILVTPEREARVLVDNLVRPRGIAITESGQLLIAETFANRLTSFQIADDGSISQRRVFANFEQMSPEGICLDAEGEVWTAAARQPLFVRVFQGGRITHRVHVPGRRAVACQLGGPDGLTLFCLTLAKNLEDYPNRPATARVETALVDVPGTGSP